jgi:hypothetical protein
VQCIGTVVRLQVQESSLKVGQTPRRYDPAPLTSVAAIAVTSEGVLGLRDDGAPITDVHHARHPHSKHRARTNGVSLGFTAHYDAMRSRFGGRLVDGIAGENILIASPRRFRVDDLSEGVVIVGEAGARLVLRPVIVAAPCVEFSRFALRFPEDARPDMTVTEALRFLDDGMRGFYTAVLGESAVVRIGDQVLGVEP